MTSTTSRLERAGHFATILMCLAVAVAAIQFTIMSRWTSPKPAGTNEAVIEPGSDVNLPKDLISSSTPTLLVAVSSRCKFCTDSMPFYKRLTELPEVRSGQLKLALLSTQAIDETRSYAAKHGVDIETIVPLAGTGLRIAATPTVILVGTDSKVSDSWVGRLDSEREQMVSRSAIGLASKGN